MNPMTRPVARLLLLLVLGPIIHVAGCGQKGPLYLPGDPSEMQAIAPEPESGQADDQATDEDDKESESSEDDPGNR